MIPDNLFNEYSKEKYLTIQENNIGIRFKTYFAFYKPCKQILFEANN